MARNLFIRYSAGHAFGVHGDEMNLCPLVLLLAVPPAGNRQKLTLPSRGCMRGSGPTSSFSPPSGVPVADLAENITPKLFDARMLTYLHFSRQQHQLTRLYFHADAAAHVVMTLNRYRARTVIRHCVVSHYHLPHSAPHLPVLDGASRARRH